LSIDKITVIAEVGEGTVAVALQREATIQPGTTEPVAKDSYVTRIGNQGCGVGYYK